MLNNIKVFLKVRFPKLFNFLKESYFIFRKQRLVTKFFGPEWNRSKKSIEIYLNFICNLNCINCDVSCRQAPGNEKVSIEQIKKFISESIENNVKWEKIRIMGGEPTLHLDILEIINLIIKYKREFSKDTRVQLVTNGFGDFVNKIISKLPNDIELQNSMKTTEKQNFNSFNIAPKDCLIFTFADYSNGCCLTVGPGIGLTPYGYYCCGVAGGIDRIIGLDMGRKKIPDPKDKMVDQFDTFCRYCGHFKYSNPTNKEVMSDFWIKAYRKYKDNKPILTTY